MASWYTYNNHFFSFTNLFFAVGKEETRSLSSNADEDESEELKETMMEQKNKIGAKNEVAGKTETGFSPLDQDEEKSDKSKEDVKEQENELVAKNEVAVKTETRSVHEAHPSYNTDEDKLEELNKTVSSDKTV